MRKSILPILLITTMPLAGCAAGMGGLSGPSVLGSVLGNVLASGAQGRGGADFQTMAIDACGAEASRYGRVSITDVRASSRSTLRVFGTVDANNFQRHAFACSYREDGRIIDFDWAS